MEGAVSGLADGQQQFETGQIEDPSRLASSSEAIA
jgi:hypothetical protein